MSIKLCYSGEILRLPFRQPVSREAVTSAAAAQWDIAPENIALFYEDDDGDTVLVGRGDSAVLEALAHHVGSVLRLRVECTRAMPSYVRRGNGAALPAGPSVRPPSPPPVAPPAVHASVVCGGCGASPIVGPRLSCGFCAGFDLCTACHGRGGARLHDASHPWWLTTAPGAPRLHVPAEGPSRHEGVACDGCGVAPIVGVRWKCAVCEVGSLPTLSGPALLLSLSRHPYHERRTSTCVRAARLATRPSRRLAPFTRPRTRCSSWRSPARRPSLCELF